MPPCLARIANQIAIQPLRSTIGLLTRRRASDRLGAVGAWARWPAGATAGDRGSAGPSLTGRESAGIASVERGQAAREPTVFPSRSPPGAVSLPPLASGRSGPREPKGAAPPGLTSEVCEEGRRRFKAPGGE